MGSPLSTSSSDGALGCDEVLTVVAGQKNRCASRLAGWAKVWSKRPRGLLWAIGIGVAVHLFAVHWRDTGPIVADELALRIERLTSEKRPAVIVAGDSRAAMGIHPIELARGLGIEEEDVISIATLSCDSTRTLSMFQRYRSRFAPEPVMVLSVSLFSVNDASVLLSLEQLYSIPFWDRLGLNATKSKQLRCLVLPELDTLARLGLRDWVIHGEEPSFSERGFRSSVTRWRPSPETLPQQRQEQAFYWCPSLALHEQRWVCLVRDLSSLKEMGVQVVVVDMPIHPVFMKEMLGTLYEMGLEQFRSDLAHLCGTLDIPYLRYDATCLGADLSQLWRDAAHLNRYGAVPLTTTLAGDVRALIKQGRIALQSTAEGGGRGDGRQSLVLARE